MATTRKKKASAGKKPAKARKATPAKAGKVAAAKASKASRAKVTVGRVVPDIALPATGGKTVGLQDLRGRHLVLYFYPKDATPGCTLEGRDFSRLADEFKAADAEVFGVSRDSLKSHENFKSKQGYRIDLLSDVDEKLCALFGVIKMKNMYGRQVRGIERSTFVIDRAGKLMKEWRGVKVPGHAEEVLAYVRSL
jgi:peroxiredoxin Q/BCP